MTIYGADCSVKVQADNLNKLPWAYATSLVRDSKLKRVALQTADTSLHI